MNVELRNIECRRVEAGLRSAFYLMGRGSREKAYGEILQDDILQDDISQPGILKDPVPIDPKLPARVPMDLKLPPLFAPMKLPNSSAHGRCASRRISSDLRSWPQPMRKMTKMSGIHFFISKSPSKNGFFLLPKRTERIIGKNCASMPCPCVRLCTLRSCVLVGVMGEDGV